MRTPTVMAKGRRPLTSRDYGTLASPHRTRSTSMLRQGTQISGPGVHIVCAGEPETALIA